MPGKGSTYWIVAFIITLCLHLISIAWQVEILSFITKPLLLAILLAYFMQQAPRSAFNKWIIASLSFSWLGDVLLMFENSDPVFFILGLSAFLLAHVFYIRFFHLVKMKENIESRWWLMVPVVLYYLVLITFLYPFLGDMKIPVPVYGIVISVMLLLALHMIFINHRYIAGLFAAGAVLFILSDSLLAINKFYQPFSAAGVLIMLTYGLAQVCLATGAIRYIRSFQPVNS